MQIIIRGQSPVIELVTPAIGAVGDMCDRSCEQECDIDFVLRKYGDAVSLQRWTNGGIDDFSDVPDDPVDRIAWIKSHAEMAEQAGIGTRGEIVDADKFNAFFGLSKAKQETDDLKARYDALVKSNTDLQAKLAKFETVKEVVKNETAEGK